MGERQSSRGTCYFCKEAFSKRGIARHLRACDAREAAEAELQLNGARQTKLLHLVADGYRTFWLHLEVPADATLQSLDSFLRGIWLECCGHLSEFVIGNTRYDAHPDPSWGAEQGMDVAIGDVVRPKMEFEHNYDFGSTTHLEMRVLSQREGLIGTGKTVRLLARNEMPDVRCEECGEPATVINVFEEYTALCDECVGTDEGLLPVVNSPRMAVCGYTGPSNPSRYEP